MKENEMSNIDEFKENKIILKKITNIMYFDYNFTQKEIADLTNVNRTKINRILNEK